MSQSRLFLFPSYSKWWGVKVSRFRTPPRISEASRMDSNQVTAVIHPAVETPPWEKCICVVTLCCFISFQVCLKMPHFGKIQSTNANKYREYPPTRVFPPLPSLPTYYSHGGFGECSSARHRIFPPSRQITKLGPFVAEAGNPSPPYILDWRGDVHFWPLIPGLSLAIPFSKLIGLKTRRDSFWWSPSAFLWSRRERKDSGSSMECNKEKKKDCNYPRRKKEGRGRFRFSHVDSFLGRTAEWISSNSL